MFPFIFVAGVQPKTKKLDETPRRCPMCGLHQAYYRRVDHYLSLFFIPIWRVRTGEAFLMCDRCERNVAALSTDRGGGPAGKPQSCPQCDRSVDPEFQYCPHCGTKINPFE